MVHASVAGALVALIIAGAIFCTLWWMMHPPTSFVQKLAKKAATELERLVGSIIVVFSADIESGHMMALAAKLARGGKSDLFAVYVIEVPFTLPPNAEMASEERAAMDALGAAESIAMSNGVSLRTQILKTRLTSQAVLDLAKAQKANLIVLGSYREGKYTGAPLGHDIEEISIHAKCDVLIGVEGKHGTWLVDESPGGSGTGSV